VGVHFIEKIKDQKRKHMPWRVKEAAVALKVKVHIIFPIYRKYTAK